MKEHISYLNEQVQNHPYKKMKELVTKCEIMISGTSP